jgi:DNA-binding transcriptional LysR family regulator
VQRASLMLLSTTSLLGFVRAAMGVTLLPALAVPNDGTLVTLPCQSKRYVRRLNLITRAGVTLAPAAIALMDAVKAEAEAWEAPNR